MEIGIDRTLQPVGRNGLQHGLARIANDVTGSMIRMVVNRMILLPVIDVGHDIGWGPSALVLVAFDELIVSFPPCLWMIPRFFFLATVIMLALEILEEGVDLAS